MKNFSFDSLIKSIEIMYNDILISQDNTTSFNQYIKDDNSIAKINTNIIVINSSHWPIKNSINMNIISPFSSIIDKFTVFYMEKNNRKKLIWVPEVSNIVLNYNFRNEKNIKRKVECHVSMIQASVLLLFNNVDQISFRDIHNMLNIPKDKLKSFISPLINHSSSLLLKLFDNNLNPKDGKDIDDSDIIMTNDIIKSKSNRIKYKPYSSKVLIEETTQTRENVEKERKIHINLAIVRIMKSKKVLEFNNLIKETTELLIKNFLPQPRIIKKCIEELIDKEYIRRDEDNNNIIHYIS